MKNLFKTLVITMFALLSNALYAQKDPFLAKIDEIKSQYNKNDLVYEQTFNLAEETKGEFYLKKGKYVMYVIKDDSTVKSVTFKTYWDSMEGDTKDKSKRTIEKEGKGFKAKKYVVTVPEKVENNPLVIDFKIDQIMNLMINSGNRDTARRNANISGVTQYYTKYINGAITYLDFSFNPEDLLGDKGKWVQVLVFER